MAGVILVVAGLPVAAGWRDLQQSEPPPPVVIPAVAPDDAVTAVRADDVEAAIECDEGRLDQPEVAVVAAAEPVADEPEPEAADSAATDKEAQDCSRALADLQTDSITGIDLDIRVGGRVPYECRLEGETFEPRRFATTTFTWKAAGYCHKPLYFEHWNLERYGHSHGFVADSFLSAAHFFARIPALPYQMGVEMPWECVYPLGYYRPGSCAPWTVPAVPVSPRGFAVGAAAATGMVFLLP